MTEQKAEKEIACLQEQCNTLRRENEDLKKRTATAEAAANIVRSLYAQYLIRCTAVREWTIRGIPETDIDEQRKLRQDELMRYSGAQALYCLLFDIG